MHSGKISLPFIGKTLSLFAIAFTAALAHAEIVTPQRGGGQVNASMKHLNVFFDGANVTVQGDAIATPILRPLTPPQAFDPAQPWSVLIDKAYNYQYAWNPGGFITLPSGGAIWVERLSQDPALEVYERPSQWTTADGPTWTELFAANGDRWKWAGSMQHNAYAVLNPSQDTYTANYRVYIGDAVTGDPLANYGSADVTLTWNASPVPEPSILILAATGIGAAALLLRGRRTKAAV